MTKDTGMQNQGAKSGCAATLFSAKPLHPTSVTAYPFTGLFPLLGKAALGAVNGSIPGGNEVSSAENTLSILAGNAQHLLLKIRCQGQNGIPEPGALQRIAIPLGAAWINAVIQSTAVSIVIIAAVLADQAPHLSELKVIEPGQLIHCQTPA